MIYRRRPVQGSEAIASLYASIDALVAIKIELRLAARAPALSPEDARQIESEVDQAIAHVREAIAAVETGMPCAPAHVACAHGPMPELRACR